MAESPSLDADGHWIDAAGWSPDWARHRAAEWGVELRSEHWQVIEHLRELWTDYQRLPPMRLLIRGLRERLPESPVDSLWLHRLFGETPLRTACLLAGLPRPEHCL